MTTTDPEYDRLRDAVVEAADNLTFEWAASNGRSQFSQLEIEAGKRLRDAANSLGAYRTRSTPPDPVPLRVERDIDVGIVHEVETLQAGGIETFESCQGGAGHSYAEPTVCFHGQQSEGFRALSVALQGGLKVTELRRYWTIEDREPVGPHWQLVFHSPCKPDTRIEPTDEAIQQADVAAYIGHAVALLDGIAELDDAESQRDLANAISLLGTAKARCDRFTQPSRIEVSEEASTRKATIFSEPSGPTLVRNPAYFSPAQPARAQQITDADIHRVWAEVEGRVTSPHVSLRREFARALLAKHTHTITKDQWEEIRKLAISDAPEAFPYGVAKVLGENS